MPHTYHHRLLITQRFQIHTRNKVTESLALISANNMNNNNSLKKITEFYLNSRDFNGIPINNLEGPFKTNKTVLKALLEEEKIVLNFGDRHPNPHILAFEPEPKEQQLHKLNGLKYQEPKTEEHENLKIQIDTLNCCVYPSKKHLKSIVNASDYQNKPYTLLLALGEPQLAYKPFNLRILEFYRNDPRYYYETDDIQGSISAKEESGLDYSDDTFLETFGFAYDKKNKNRYVATLLIYLSRLSPEHQQRWSLEEYKEDTFLHPDYARTICGEWSKKESIFNAFCEEIGIINKMTSKITGKALFCNTYNRYNKPKEFGFLIRTTRKEYENFVLLLDKMMSDNLDRNFFKDKIEPMRLEKRGKNHVEKDKGTIALLEEWIDMSIRFPDPKPKNEMIKIFREIRKERQKPGHHVREDKWDNLFFSKQRELIIKAYNAVRTLRLIFANHRRAKSVEVPDWVFKGEIQTY